MRIVLFLRLSFSGQALHNAVKTDPILSGKFDSLGLAQMSTSSEEFSRLTEIAASLGDGFGWTPWVEYTAGEIKDLEHFEIWPKKHVSEGNSSWEINRSTFGNSSPIQTLPGSRVRVLREIQIASIRGLSKNSIGSLGETWKELIAGSEAAAALLNAGLRGFSLRPVLREKSREPFGDYSQIICENFLAHHADRDITIISHRDHGADGSFFRHLGSLSYRKGELDSALDFNRTSEGWDNEQPLWIVTRRVIECCQVHNIKGLRFRPVLTIGTKLHQEYTDKFEQLFELVGKNPQNRLW